jgi:hypothetical protein
MSLREYIEENLKEDLGMVASDSASDVLKNLETVTATIASIFSDLQKDSRMYKSKEIEAKIRELRDGLKKLKAPQSNDIFTREDKQILNKISEGIISVTTDKITSLAKSISDREDKAASKIEPAVSEPELETAPEPEEIDVTVKK